MKVRTLVAVLIIAAPLSAMWAASLNSEELLRDDRAQYAQQLGDFGTRFDRSSGTTVPYKELNETVKRQTNGASVSVVMNRIEQTGGFTCSDCRPYMVWGPTEGVLGRNSQLVSGRWPQDSSEVLVSDAAARQGATTSGTVTITQLRPDNTGTVSRHTSAKYTVVGVARTVVGQEQVLYTTLLDDKVVVDDFGSPPHRQDLWFIPGAALADEKAQKLENAGLTQVRLHVDTAHDFAWFLLMLPFLVLTAIACLIVTGVFIHGLGRMRQSLNVVLTNGGSRRTVLLCAAMQGALVGAMVCAVQAGVGFGRVALSMSQTLPAQYPLGADIASVPYVPMLVMLVATFGFVVTASIGPAAGMRISEVTHQSKSYSAVEAQQDFAPAQLAAWTKVGLIAALVSWPMLVIAFRWEPSSPRLSAEVSYAVVLLAPAVAVAVSISSVVAGFDWLVKRIRDHLWQRGRLESGAGVSLSTGSLLIALCAGLVVFFQALMVGWPAISTHKAYAGYESYNLAPYNGETPDDVISRIRNSGKFSGLQMSPVFDLGAAPTLGAVDRKPETHVLPGTCRETDGRLVDGRGVASCQPQVWTRMLLSVMKRDDLRRKYALNEAEVSKLAAGTALVLRTSHAADTAQYRDGITLARFSHSRGTSRQTMLESSVSMPVQAKTVERIPARAGNFRVLVAQEYLQQHGVATYATQLETRRRVSLNWWEQQRLLSLIGGEPSSTFLLSKSSRVLMLVAGFLGLLLALSSLGAAGQVRALRDLGASFGRRYRVVALHCVLAGLVVAIAGSIFGVIAGSLMSGAAVLTTHGSYVSWQQPLWQYMWIPLLIPLVAVLCAAPLTSVWSRSAPDTVASGNWRQLHFLGVGVTMAILAVFVWLVVTGGISI